MWKSNTNLYLILHLLQFFKYMDKKVIVCYITYILTIRKNVVKQKT